MEANQRDELSNGGTSEAVIQSTDKRVRNVKAAYWDKSDVSCVPPLTLNPVREVHAVSGRTLVVFTPSAVMPGQASQTMAEQ